MPSEAKFSVQQRYVLGLMIFVIYVMSAVYRSGFPLILTQMVYIPNSGTNSSSPNHPNDELICPMRHSTPKYETTILNDIKIGDIDNRYQWSQEFQGIILSSMFWGNIVSKIPGGSFISYNIDSFEEFIVSNSTYSRWHLSAAVWRENSFIDCGFFVGNCAVRHTASSRLWWVCCI